MNVVSRHIGQDLSSQSGRAQVLRSPMSEIDVALSDLFEAIGKHPFIIAATILLSLAATILHLSMREPIYQSTATLIVDPARPNILASQQVSELQIVDSGVVDSVVEIISSDFIAQAVAKKLGLMKDPEFMRERGLRRYIRPLINMIKPPKPMTEVEIERVAATLALKQLDVKRLGMTYVVEVTAQSETPESASNISNAFVESYLENEVTVKMNMTRKASTWLENRTSELRDRLGEADAAVQKYRTENNLIEPKDGKLPLDQQMAELTTKLSETRGKETIARVLAERIGDLIAQGDFDSAAISAEPETAVRKLRDSFLELSAREKELASRVGRQHRLTLNARAETERAQAQLKDEIAKYQESLRNEAKAAGLEVAQLDAELAKLNVGQFEVGAKSIQLRELERNADSARLLYETFLARLKEMRQQETLPVQDARLIASAVPATNPINLSSAILVGSALGGGLLLGMLLALLRERFDPTIRSVKDAEAATGLKVLTVLDEVRSHKGKILAPRLGHRNQHKLGQAGAEVDRLLTHALDHPFSSFAESFRELRLVLNRYTTNGAKFIGVVTAAPGEGKSTTACNLALLYAASGARTLLIDCDLRNPTLSAQLSPSAMPGLPDVLMGKIAWSDAIQIDDESNLAFLSGTSTENFGNPADVLAQPALDELMEEASKLYDVVVLDTAPMAAATDALVIAPLVDVFVLVVASGKTDKNKLRQLLEHSPDIYDKLAGVLLNRARGKNQRQTYPGSRSFARIPTPLQAQR